MYYTRVTFYISTLFKFSFKIWEQIIVNSYVLKTKFIQNLLQVNMHIFYIMNKYKKTSYM